MGGDLAYLAQYNYRPWKSVRKANGGMQTIYGYHCQAKLPSGVVLDLGVYELEADAIAATQEYNDTNYPDWRTYRKGTPQSNFGS